MSRRSQTYALESYIQAVLDKDIRPDPDTQRVYGSWKNADIDKLIKTIYNDKFGYIPPVFLAEEIINGMKRLWILDGLHRSMSLVNFKDNKHRISIHMKDSIVKYQAKKRDKDGRVICDENGDEFFETKEFDLRGKIFDDLPPEMKKKFNNYQLDTVIFEDCSKEEQAELVRIYNTHTGMSTAQRAFTYIDKFARQIREITEHDFFKNCGKYTDRTFKNGYIERVITESVALVFYPDLFKGDATKTNDYLNDHATEENFEVIKTYFDRLNTFCEDKYQNYFNPRNTHLFVKLFSEFTKFDLPDERFGEFLTAFENGLADKEYNFEDETITYKILDEGKRSHGKGIVEKKIKFLTYIMKDYFGITEEDENTEDETVAEKEFVESEPVNKSVLLAFVRKNVDENIDEEDLVTYEEHLEMVLEKALKSESKLRSNMNHRSMVAMVAYSYQNDTDDELADFFADYAKIHPVPEFVQNKNFLYMKDAFDKYCEKHVA